MTEVEKPNGRLRWDQAPLAVRSWAEDVLGESVVQAASQPGASLRARRIG